MKKLLFFCLFLIASVAMEAQTIKLNSNGSQVAIAIDDILQVRPVSASGSGSVISYQTIQQKLTVDESMTAIKNASCSKLVSLSVYETVSGVEKPITLLFNVLSVAEIRPTSNGKAIITLRTTPRTTFRSTGSYATVANTFSACISGGGGGTTTVVHDSTLTGNGTSLSPLSVVDAGGGTPGTNSVTNTMLAQMPALTIKGNNTGSTADAKDLTVTQVNAMLSVDDLISMTGLAIGNSNLLTFTGTIIPDNTTIKIALQSLETAIESIGAMATFQDDGVSLTHRSLLNFIGPSITLNDNPGAGATDFTFDSDLNALASMTTNGVLVRTGTGAITSRTIVSGAAGLSVTNGSGVSGNPSIAPADDLAAIEDMNTNGLVARIGTDNWTNRVITGPAAGMIITNGSGISGNPTIALANDLAAVEALSGTGFAIRTATDTWTNVPFDVTGPSPSDIMQWDGTTWAPAALPVQAYVYDDDAGMPPPITPDIAYGPFFGWNEGAVEWWSWDGIEWVLEGSAGGSFFTSSEFTGDGTSGSPLTLAQQSATSGQVLKWNGTSWAPSQVVTNGDKGDVDVTSFGDVWTIDTSSVTTIKVADGAITMPKIAQSGATTNQVIKWNGSAWAPAADAGGSSITDFTASMGAAPSVAASSHPGETYRNSSSGELWRSDGSTWYSFSYGGKECQDTVLVSAITVQSGGVVSTGSPLIRNSSGVWEHMYNHPGGLDQIPDGVITDVISGPKAIIKYCGVQRGSGATPNSSYYVDQTQSTGFTTTKPTSDIRPLGKVASNGDFLVNAGLLFSKDNFPGIVINGSLTGAGIVGDTLKISNGDKWDVDVTNNGLIWTVDTGAINTIKILDAAVTMAKIAQAGATTGQVIKWNGSAWAPGTDGGGSGGGPDSTLAKTNGSYLNKRITDNVYKNGTLGVRTTDTTAVINIKENTNSKPMIGFSSNSAWLINSAKDTRANSGLIQNFGISKSFNDSASTSGDNQVFHYGFNVGAGGTVLDVTKSAMWVSLENSFNNPSSYRAYEIHIPQILYPGGQVRRPFSGYYSNESSIIQGSTLFSNDFISFYDYKTNVQMATWGFGIKNAYQPYNRGITFLDTAGIYFQKSHQFATGIFGRRFDNSADIKMIGTDASDRVVLGGYNETSIVATNSLEISGAGTLWNTGNNITIGKSGTLATLNLYGNVLMKWGPTFGGDIFQHRIDGNDWTMFAYGSSTFMWYVSKNAPSNAFSIAGTTGNLGLGVQVGLAKVHAVSTSGATSKMIRLENTTGLNDVYRTSVIPEGAITANPGDIALSSISSIGRFWLKKTGTGNTGWIDVGGLAEGGWQLTGNSVTAGTQFLGSTNNVSLRFRTNNVQRMMIDSTGNVGIGLASVTAALHLKAGTATASTSPLKFTSGTNMTTPEAGAMEWDGTNLFITQTSGPTRKTLAYTTDVVNLYNTNGTIGSARIATLTDNLRIVKTTDAGSGTAPLSVRVGGTAPGLQSWVATTGNDSLTIKFDNAKGFLVQSNHNIIIQNTDALNGITINETGKAVVTNGGIATGSSSQTNIVSTPVTIASGISTIVALPGASVINLPVIGTSTGEVPEGTVYWVTNFSTATVTINPGAGANIQSTTSVTLADTKSAWVKAIGSGDWAILIGN